MIDLDSLCKEFLADPEVVKEYEAQKLEFAIAHALIEARIASSEIAKNP